MAMSSPERSRKKPSTLRSPVTNALSRGSMSEVKSCALLASVRAMTSVGTSITSTRVYRFALKRLRDTGEAEDVTQEVFVTVFRALGSYQAKSTLLVWIFGITRNKVNRRFRGLRAKLETVDGEAALQMASADAPTDRAVDARRMLARCEEVIESRLTPLQRRIFHLKHLRRQSIRNIAEALGKSEDAIKANLYRMRRTIAEAAPGLEQILSA